MTDTETIADVVVAAVKVSTAGLVADLKVMQSQVAGWEARWSDLGAIRERLAVVEDRAKSVPVSAVLEARDVTDLAPVLARLDALEIRAVAPGPVGPAGRDGADGKDAPAVDLDEVAMRAAALVPFPKDGRDGINGKDAPPVDVEDVARRAAALVPKPKDGHDGIDGHNGVGVAGAVIDKDGSLVLTFSDGTMRTLGLVVGKAGEKGEPGEKGSDGLNGRDGTLEGASFKQIDDRTGQWLRSDGSVLGTMAISAIEYHGIYASGQSYAKGDAVTHGGSLWIARDATNTRPGDGATAWQLAAKCGRDGIHGKPGKDSTVPGPRGEKGEPGRNFS
jgi:hypothetical protein